MVYLLLLFLPFLPLQRLEHECGFVAAGDGGAGHLLVGQIGSWGGDGAALGCDMIQGFYFAKPMPVAEFEEKVEKDA